MGILLATVFAFLVTFLAIPLVIKISDVRQLFDVPNKRKSHTRNVPVLGGAAILIGVISGSVFFTSILEWHELKYIITALCLIYLMGLVDDLKETSFFIKLLAQIVAALVVVLFGEIAITNFYGLFAIFEISYGLSIVVSVMLIIMLMNAFNFIDGIDGLSSALGIIASLVLGLYFLMNGNNYYATFSLSLTGSLVAFIFFNYPPAKLFMGDAGSLVIGLIISILIIKFIEISPTVSSLRLLNAPAVAFGIIVIPLFDLLRVIVLRIFQKRSPFKPDQIHIHHVLKELNFSDSQVVIYFSVFASIMIVLNFIAGRINLGVNYLMAINFIVLIVHSYIIHKKKSRSSK